MHFKQHFHKFIKILAQICRFFFWPFLNIANGEQPKQKCRLMSTAAAISLPNETFEQIIAFSDTETISQSLVFVSRSFSELSFPILREHINNLPSSWQKDFVDPITSPYFDFFLKNQRVRLVCAHVDGENANEGLPTLTGRIRTCPVDQRDSMRTGEVSTNVNYRRRSLFDPAANEVEFSHVLVHWKWQNDNEHRSGWARATANSDNDNEYFFSFQFDKDKSMHTVLHFYIEYRSELGSHYYDYGQTHCGYKLISGKMGIIRRWCYYFHAKLNRFFP